METIPGHGGTREGAGRPSGPKTEAGKRFDEARARNELAKALINEVKAKVELGEYLPRAAYMQANATALALLTQSIRSIPDNLERRFNLPPEVLEAIGEAHDAALAEVANSFKLMLKPPNGTA
jgi:hypothetical protein